MNKKELELKEYDNIWCLDENDYENEINTTLEECLNKVKKTGFVNSDDKEEKNIYYEGYINSDSKGTIIICHGFTESVEKFKEMIYYFFNAGYSVFAIEHRGHGRSWRATSNWSVTHIDDFEEYVSDLKALMEKEVKPVSDGKPVYLYAHSMGGAIATLYAEEYPNDISKVILSSPMLSINFGNYPAWMGVAMAKTAAFFGKAKEKMFVHQEFNPDEKFEDSSATSLVRFQRYFKERIAHQEFQNYAGSYAWLIQSVAGLKKIFKTENLKKLSMPILLFQAENDTVVTPEGQLMLANEVESVSLVYVKESKHEIYMTPNYILNPYLHEIFEFLEK